MSGLPCMVVKEAIYAKSYISWRRRMFTAARARFAACRIGFCSGAGNGGRGYPARDHYQHRELGPAEGYPASIRSEIRWQGQGGVGGHRGRAQARRERRRRRGAGARAAARGQVHGGRLRLGAQGRDVQRLHHRRSEARSGRCARQQGRDRSDEKNQRERRQIRVARR